MLLSPAPHTPPAGQTGARRQLPVPQFELPDRTPKTPQKKPSLFQTPSSKGKNVQLKTPTTVRQSKAPFTFGASSSTHESSSSSGLLLPPTPEFTPHKSPRAPTRKKRPNMGDLLLPAAPVDHMAMFLPNHATVGSGRRNSGTLRSLKAPILLDFAELSQINENLTFEEDLYDEIMLSPTKRPRRKKSAPLQTPGPQLITEDKVDLWHGKSYNTAFSSDEEDDFTPGKALVNPFLTSNTPKKVSSRTFFGSSPPLVDYSTHNEYINHKTGERKVEELLESERRFKPKKIDFSGL